MLNNLVPRSLFDATRALGFSPYFPRLVGCLAYTLLIYLGIAGLAPRARHFFATAQKSTQKWPPRPLRPCKKHRGAHRFSTVIML